MKVISDPVNKDLPELFVGWIVGLAFFLLELGFDVEQPDVSVVLGNEIWNLTSGQDHIDELKEILMSDLSISQQERTWDIHVTGPVIELPDEVPQLGLTESFG